MSREWIVGFCMLLGFTFAYLGDAPLWACAMAAWITGMWADLRMGR